MEEEISEISQKSEQEVIEDVDQDQSSINGRPDSNTSSTTKVSWTKGLFSTNLSIYKYNKLAETSPCFAQTLFLSTLSNIFMMTKICF